VEKEGGGADSQVETSIAFVVLAGEAGRRNQKVVFETVQDQGKKRGKGNPPQVVFPGGG